MAKQSRPDGDAATSSSSARAQVRAEALPLAALAELTDAQLADAARAGDEMAFAQLFERHRRTSARLAYRFFPRREQVEEIIQESFIKAWFALGDFQGGNEKSFVSWLARITVRTCYDELRRQQRRAESSLGELTEDEAAYLSDHLRDRSPSGNVERAAVSRDLATKLLARLKPEDRVLISLLKLEELSVAEIAELMGWTVAKVKMRSHRAQQGLRKVLKRYV